MAESVKIEKAVCATCDADIRENTAFCYNCGSKLEAGAPLEKNGSPIDADENSKAALDDLAEKLSHGDDEEKLAKAATERKKARVVHRKRNEFKWEPRDDSPVLGLLLAGFVMFATLLVVILLVIWK